MSKKIISSKSEVKKALDKYFTECDPHIKEVQIVDYKADKSGKVRTIKTKTRQRPYTLSGIASALNLTTKEFKDLANPYTKKETKIRVNAPIRKLLIEALQRVEEYAENNLYTSGKSQGSQFVLKNIGEWKDRFEHDTPGLSSAVVELEKSLSKALSGK